MKGKLFNIILIVAIIIIWGILVVKVYKALSPDIVYPVTNLNKIDDIKEDEKIKDSLIINYKDPFLNESFTPKEVSFNAIPKVPNPPIINPVPINIATPTVSIQYLGRANSSKGSQVGVFKIENQEVLIQKGETYNNVKIETIWNDSAKVIIDKKIRIIRL